MKQKIINLIGGPGAGKSTGAAYIFSQLKMKGINCELAPEFAKDKVWEENKTVFENQLYLFGKQSFRFSRLKDKVDVIITDSPLFLNMYYVGNKPYYKSFRDVVMQVIDEYDNYTYFINRVKEYNPAGRFQDEEGAKKVDMDLKNLISDFKLPYQEYDGSIEGYNLIIKNYFFLSEQRVRNI